MSKKCSFWVDGYNIITRRLNDRYLLNLDYPVENQIESIGYSIPDLKLKVNYNAVSELLMGENIYGSKKAGLREMIQNSIDALKIREEIENRVFEYGDDNYYPKIKIILDETNNQVILKDNGIGMNQEILEKYFLNVGVSYYKSNDYIYKGLNYKPVGNFGIGFLACFMLSPIVTIKTRHLEERRTIIIELEKGSEFICLKDSNESFEAGTEIIFDFNSFMSIFNYDKNEIFQYVKRYFVFDSIKVDIIDKKNKETLEIKQSFESLLELYKDENRDMHNIDLSQYLKGFKGYISFDYDSQNLSVGNFKDAFKVVEKDYSNLFFLKNGDLLPGTTEINGDDYINNDRTVNFVRLLIVKNDKQKMFMDEYYAENRAIEPRMGSILDRVYIVLSKDIELPNSEIIYDNNDISRSIAEELGVTSKKNLELMGHTLDYEYFVDISKETVFFSKELNKAIAVRDYKYFLDNKGKSYGIFLRDVAVKSDLYHIESLSFYLPYHFRSSYYILNINNNEIIPDVSRRNLSNDSMVLLDDAISQIVIYETVKKNKLNESDIRFYDEYIRNYFNIENKLLRNKLI